MRFAYFVVERGLRRRETALASLELEIVLSTVLLIHTIMSEPMMDSPMSETNDTFQSEHSWMVQCLSLAALALVTYMHLAPMIT